MAEIYGDAETAPPRQRGMLSIGQFSRVTGLTIKTIRLYHEKGLLPPTYVDSSSGYRYFGERDVERARLVADLRALELSLAEIKEILDESPDGVGALEFLEAQRARIEARRAHLGSLSRELDRLIRTERDALDLARATPHEIAERDLEPVLFGGLRWTGSYGDTGKILGRVCRRFGRVASGAPFNLYFDLEYKEDGAEIESCVPLREVRDATGFTVRTLPAIRAVCLVHQGPYSEISRSYARLMAWMAARGHSAGLPIREIYRKGPGLLLKGNPRNYLTEIQIPIVG